MNNEYDVLERSLLGDHTGLVASNSESVSAADRHPHIYTVFLVLAALAGYGVLFMFPAALITLAVVIPGTIIEAQNKLDVIMVLSLIASSVFVAWMSWYLFKLRLALPAGRPLKNEEAPLLFELIQEIRNEYGAPVVHTVRIVQDYHLEIVKTPMNGFPVAFTHTLLIGLPLIQSMSARQLNLAIRREVAHLARNYRRISGWAFHLRRIWCQYRDTHQSGWHPAGIIMRSFFCWYAPLFRLVSQAANREEIFYADQVVNAGDRNFIFIDMLITQSIHKRYLDEKFWPRLLNTAYKHPSPPYLPYASIEKNLRTELNNETAQQLLDAAMSEHSNHGGIPALRQRLHRLGIQTVMRPDTDMHSATRFFTESSLDLIVRQLDHIWVRSRRYEWQQKYRTGQLEQNKLKELQVQARQGLLTNNRAWEYIQLIKKYLDDQQALDQYKEVLKIDLDDARINYDIGKTLLDHKDAQGIEALENAFGKDAGYTVMACQLTTDYFVRTGNKRSAQAYRRKALAYQVEAA